MTKTRLKNEKKDNLSSIERRRFLGASAKYGFTTAIVAASAGTLISDEALAFTAKEEKERKASAKFEMIIGTQSTLGSSRGMAAMQLDLKKIFKTLPTVLFMLTWDIVENLVLEGAGQQGSKRVIQCGQHSISNLAPFVPS